MSERQISKVLSANDIGTTGGHQAGILVPKNPALLSFFPNLDANRYNPRAHLRFIDDAGMFWEFAYIYYNNALFGGTRNDFRLTRMTKFIRQAGLAEGDELILSRHGERYRVSYLRRQQIEIASGVLQLGTGWRVVHI